MAHHNTKHGHRSIYTGSTKPSRTYVAWCQMRQRCANPNCKAYPNYGGRGIIVCDAWNDFQTFLEDMGEPLPGFTMHRIDNDQGYSPENCQWASPKTQANNRRSNNNLTLNGVTMTIAEWSDFTGIKKTTIWMRLYKHGWDLEKTLTEPVK